jgi:hypothetical protein
MVGSVGANRKAIVIKEIMGTFPQQRSRIDFAA